MRISILLIFLFLTNISCSQKVESKKDFEETVYKVIDSYNNNDLNTINDLINKDIGLFVIYKIGINPSIIRTDHLNEKGDSLKINQNLPMWIKEEFGNNYLSKKYKINYSSYPIFDIECEIPSKTGLFVNPKEKNIDVLKEAVDYYKWEEKHYNFDKNETWDTYSAIINKLSANTLKIIYAGDYNDNPESEYKKIFIFYLTNINNKWYLTVLDYYTIDCSA